MFFIRWQIVVDFVVLSVALYWLLHLGRQTRVLRMVIGIGGLLLCSVLASRVDLPITAGILLLVALVAVLLLVLLYYAEIRYALTHLDPLTRLARTGNIGKESDFRAISEAAFALGAANRGALLVLVGKISLDHLLTGGVPLGGKISQEIIEAIFRKVSPVHDGATIIDDAQISRVGVFLPLTRRTDLPTYLGTRHRSALGLAEQSDALIIVVSEERGEVSVVQGKTIRKVEQVTDLMELLKAFSPGTSSAKSRTFPHRVFNNWQLKLISIGLALLVWGLIFPVNEVRRITVPIEFQNVPLGLEVVELSSTSLVVQLRAVNWFYSGLSTDHLVAKIDLKSAPEGFHTTVIQEETLGLPPGIVLVKVTPAILTIRLVSRQGNSP